MNKVCNHLSLGNNNKEVLKYNKYRHLDLSNLKQINVSRAALTHISKWIRECHNLKILDLSWNNI